MVKPNTSNEARRIELVGRYRNEERLVEALLQRVLVGLELDVTCAAILPSYAFEFGDGTFEGTF